jgi:hypothetical protein
MFSVVGVAHHLFADFCVAYRRAVVIHYTKLLRQLLRPNKLNLAQISFIEILISLIYFMILP